MNKYLEELKNSPLVREKDLGNGVHSYNFTRDAFFNAEWNETTERARGIFCDEDTEKVVARSFDKFFAIGERPETEMDALKKTLKFPLKVFRKENGFLGICAYRAGEKNNLFVASKSTNQGDYAGYFRTILDRTMSDKDQQFFAGILHGMNASAVFEVIDPINDPHIVEYKEAHLVLLALIQNEYEYMPYSYFTLGQIAQIMNLQAKELVTYLVTWDDFVKFIKQAEGEKNTEGYVIEDRDGFMLKIKNNWYKYWKKIRSVVQAINKDKMTSEAICQRYKLSNSDQTLLNFLYDYVREANEYGFGAEELKDIPTIRRVFLEELVPEVER